MDKPVPDADDEDHLQKAAEQLFTLYKGSKGLVPRIFRSALSYRKSCALLGCSLPMKQEGSYCCSEHEHLSNKMSRERFAFHIFDGFRDGNDRDTTCASCLILKNSGVNIGIPTLNYPEIFSTVPWDLRVFKTDPDESSRDWLFFHNKRMECGLVWRSNKRKRFIIEAKNFDTTTLSLRSGENKEKWILYLFQHEEVSLYCLSYTNEAVQKQKNSKATHNKKNDHQKDEDQNNEEDQNDEDKDSGKGTKVHLSSLFLVGGL